MTHVHYRLLDVDGVSPVGGQSVSVKLGGITNGAFDRVFTATAITVGGAVVESTEATQTSDSSGNITFALAANSLISPAGTIWQVKLPNNGIKWIVVPDSLSVLELDDLVTVTSPSFDPSTVVVDSVLAVIDPVDPGILDLTFSTYRLTDSGTAFLIGATS